MGGAKTVLEHRVDSGAPGFGGRAIATQVERTASAGIGNSMSAASTDSADGYIAPAGSRLGVLTLFRGTAPFVGLMFLTLAIVIAFPQLSLMFR